MDGLLIVLPADAALGCDPRFAGDAPWVSCPVAAAAEPWLREAVEHRQYLACGGQSTDRCARPSAALSQAVALLECERNALSAQQMTDERNAAKARQGAQGG